MIGKSHRSYRGRLSWWLAGAALLTAVGSTPAQVTPVAGAGSGPVVTAEATSPAPTACTSRRPATGSWESGTAKRCSPCSATRPPPAGGGAGIEPFEQRSKMRRSLLRAAGGALAALLAPGLAPAQAPVPGANPIFTDAFTETWQPSEKPFMVAIVTFEDLGDGQTRYRAVARHWSAEDRAAHEAMGFHEGWGIVADQLAALAKTL